MPEQKIVDERETEYNSSANRWLSKDASSWLLTRARADDWLARWNDMVSSQQRSRMMAAVRGADTLPELYVRKKNGYHLKYKIQTRGDIAKDVMTEKYLLGMRILMLGFDHALRVLKGRPDAALANTPRNSVAWPRGCSFDGAGAGRESTENR